MLGAAFLFGITTAEGLVEFYDDGHGPLAQLPLWLQAGIFLVGSDLMMYWIHRTFHRPVLWKYHAVHHSSEDLDWISAARFHPVNIFLGSVATDVVLLLAGISPNVLVFLGPVHDRAFGLRARQPELDARAVPLCAGRARSSIAGTTPRPTRAARRTSPRPFRSSIVLFGTFYMPKNELPDAYGVADQAFRPASARR